MPRPCTPTPRGAPAPAAPPSPPPPRPSRRALLLGSAAAATLIAPAPPPASAFDVATAPLAPPSPAVSLYAAAAPATATVIDMALSPNGGGGVGAYADAARGNGSGFVWSREQGLIVTAAHVLSSSLAKGAVGGGLSSPGPTVARVTLNGGGVARTLDAVLVGASPDRDVALLRVSPAALTTSLPIADTDARPGDTVYAIGSGYGFPGTLSGGIVSATGRAIPNPAAALVPGGGGGTVLPMCLQTDAPTAPGSSG